MKEMKKRLKIKLTKIVKSNKYSLDQRIKAIKKLLKH